MNDCLLSYSAHTTACRQRKTLQAAFLCPYGFGGGNPESCLFWRLKCTDKQSFIQPKLPIKILPLYIKRYGALTSLFMQVCASRLVVLTTKGEGKRRAASDCLCGIAYLAICAIIKTEIADVARRLPRNFIVDRKYRLPSGRRYFCYLTEMMMATKVPNAIIKDNASYTLIVSPPLLEKWETDHRTISECYYST